MDRDRVNAMLASVGDEPHWTLCRQLLAEYDKAVASRETWRVQAGEAIQMVDRLSADLDAANEDAAQLAAHIVSHPTGGYERVLEHHDRRIG
jgi:hypothetical protein